MITITKPQKSIILRPASKRRSEITAEPDMVEKLSGYGLTEKEIADIYGVTIKQFYRAMRKYKSINEAVYRGKNRAAKNIMESLYRKASGFTRREIIYTKHKGVATAHPVTKYYPPDMKAIVFWLKNRCPMEWREKIDIEKGQYLIGEKQMEFLRKEAVKAMYEMM